MTMVYSDEGALSSLDNHRLFFLLQRRAQSFSLAHYTYSKGSHTHLFICWGGQGPKVKGKLLGTQRLSQGIGNMGSLFRSLKQSHGTKQGMCNLQPHHWEGD